MKKSLVFIAILVSAGMAFDAFACGDSLYRVGKGVSYRVYTAPLPGSVLVYGHTDGAKQLAEELARSGHGVRLVSNDAELQSELKSGDYDVVIAAYSDHTAVETTVTATSETVTEFIPVAENEQEEELAKQHYQRVMTAQKDDIKDYLKAIHQSLKTKT
jgi:hypothetical protein